MDSPPTVTRRRAGGSRGPGGNLPGFLDGFERPAPTGLPCHHPYRGGHLIRRGLEKETDCPTGRLTRADSLPPEFLDGADAAAAQAGCYPHPLTTSRELRRWIPRIAEARNRAFADTGEFCPLNPGEIQMIGDRLLAPADPRPTAAAIEGEQTARRLFVVPDPADGPRATRRCLLRFGWTRLLLEVRRTRESDRFGMGLLPQHRGAGANAVIHAAVARTLDRFPISPPASSRWKRAPSARGATRAPWASPGGSGTASAASRFDPAV